MNLRLVRVALFLIALPAISMAQPWPAGTPDSLKLERCPDPVTEACMQRNAEKSDRALNDPAARAWSKRIMEDGARSAGGSDVTVGTDGIACPVVSDLYVLYKTDMGFADVASFVSKHGCDPVSKGHKYQLLDRGLLVSRIMVHATAMFVRTVDLSS